MKNIQIKKAFTLAEVLITLGIIGVVSAMTIPTLIQNYNQRAWDTGATVFNRKLEEALKTMNTQQTLAGHTTTESFVEELSRHFKTNKICTNNKLLDCFSETVYWGGGDDTPEEVDMSEVKTSKHLGQEGWSSNVIGVQFANGVNAMVAYNPECIQDPYSNEIAVNDCLAILYDTSGMKNPNTKGKDLRANGNVISLGKNCAFKLDKTCFATVPFYSSPISKTECESLKSDLGIKECNTDNDYWAGAVKACGGVSNMASLTEIAKIAEYVYNKEDIGAREGVTGLKFDTTKAAEIGLSSSGLYFWSTSEINGSYVDGRGFSTSTSLLATYARNTARLAICLEN